MRNLYAIKNSYLHALAFNYRFMLFPCSFVTFFQSNSNAISETEGELKKKLKKKRKIAAVGEHMHLFFSGGATRAARISSNNGLILEERRNEPRRQTLNCDDATSWRIGLETWKSRPKNG